MMARRLLTVVTCALLAALAGCTTPPSLPTIVMDPDVANISAPLITGMSQIRDKAIEPPDIDRLFIAALTHLSVIDPDIRVEATETELSLKLGELSVARVERPHAQDIGAWTDATQSMITAGRKVSLSLLKAGSETFLTVLFEGATPLLDPYTRYAGRREALRNREARNGFVGLGLELATIPAGASVSLTLVGGPADMAGMLPGDIITHVDGRRLSSQPLPVILRRLDGPRDTAAHLTVNRAGAVMDFQVRRALIIPESVKAESHDGILELTVKVFNQRTAAAIAEKVAAAGPLRGIILDLRGDPGGLLDQGVAVADLFLDSGVIATLRGRHPGSMQFYAASEGDIAKHAPIVMLLDGRSASASEILAAALQENGRAIAIGTASVGKGTVQTVVPLSNGGEIALTWSRVFSPSGTLLNGRGVLPDVCTADKGADPVGVDEVMETVRRKGPRPRLDVDAARTSCRPAPHTNKTIDLDVARRLVTDAPLLATLHPADGSQFATSH